MVWPLDFSSVGRTGSGRASDRCVSRRDYSSSRLHRLYCAYAVHPNAPSRRSTSRQSVALALAVCLVISLCIVTTRLAAATDILHLHRASGCFDTSCGLSRGLSSTTSPRAGSSSTTSHTPRVRVPQHVAAHHAARRRLLRLRRASGCLGTSCGSSHDSSRRS
jgi:hypothetical protein